MIKLKNVSKYYYSKGVIATGFSKINLEFQMGEFVAITGESGSGKSTLLNVISGLDSYEEGEMYVNGQETSHYLEKDWENYRRKNIGNIYQNFNLINSYTVYQNIDLILSLNGIKKRYRKEKILELLKRVDMLKYKNTKVSKLSGGQKQRIAIARALAKDVPIIIADEPTGSLDKRSATNIIKLLKEISKDKLVIIVTHNYEQVAEYATRKITMHDGKILEDKVLKKSEDKVEYCASTYKNISIPAKLQIGLRNTFNILPKFILLLLVYSFIVASLMFEYSYFKKGEYEASKNGFNYIFSDLNDHRIIMNKKDKSAFSEEEIESIKKMNNIDYIIENDTLIDQNTSLSDTDNMLWLSGSILPYELFKGKVDVGSLPTAPNEIILEGSKDDYYLSQEIDNILNKILYSTNNFNGELDKTKAYKVVGIKYVEDTISYTNQFKFYLSTEELNKLLFSTHEFYSEVTINFMGQNHKSSNYSNEFKLAQNNWVTSGTAIVPESYNIYCEKENCLKKTFTVNIKNPYYSLDKDFYIEKNYNNRNINYTLELNNYNKEDFDSLYNGIIYINPIDYKELFNKGTYQMSVYVKDIEQIEHTVTKLNELGYKTLKVKDTLVNPGATEILKIVKLIITCLLIFVLFFISYFIIKIILKSRNIYFSILRMLGASKRVCKELLAIELLTISNLAYFIFIGFAEYNKVHPLNLELINTVNTYFKYNDYLILYLIITFMSFLISMRYARKLFKNSVMSSYREEI